MRIRNLSDTLYAGFAAAFINPLGLKSEAGG